MKAFSLICFVLVVASPGMCRAQATTDGALPTLFLIGDSTVKNRTKGQLGWGEPLVQHFDAAKIKVINRALGGRSSRTFLTEGLWDKVVAELNAEMVVVGLNSLPSSPFVALLAPTKADVKP